MFIRIVIDCDCVNSSYSTLHAIKFLFSHLPEPNSLRKCEELPWHLKICKKWNTLRDTLVDLRTFDLMFNNDLKDELMEYWLLLTEGSWCDGKYIFVCVCSLCLSYLQCYNLMNCVRSVKVWIVCSKITYWFFYFRFSLWLSMLWCNCSIFWSTTPFFCAYAGPLYVNEPSHDKSNMRISFLAGGAANATNSAGATLAATNGNNSDSDDNVSTYSHILREIGELCDDLLWCCLCSVVCL